MDHWRRYLGLFLWPFSLCRLMLFIASLSKQMANEYRRTLLVTSVILAAPGVILMPLTMPLR
jgi:hypothetical protein